MHITRQSFDVCMHSPATYIHIISCMFSLAGQRSNESLKSGASSTYGAYQFNDKKGMGDNKSAAGSTSNPTRRSSITSIKSFTAILPSVPETIESEPSSSDSLSAINMNMDSSSEVQSEDKDTTMGETIEVQIVEMAISENLSVTSENEREDYNSITGEADNTRHAEQTLSSNKVDSIPDIKINGCTDFKSPRYKRRMSKSCDELDVKGKWKSRDTNGKWKSWSNLLSSISNSMTRAMHSVSNSISHVDQLVDTQNDKPPEENQTLVENNL